MSKISTQIKTYKETSKFRQGALLKRYDADSIALFEKMTIQPTSARKNNINDSIVSLKSAGVWDKIDQLIVGVAHDVQASTLDWKGKSNITLVNSPSFTIDSGIVPDGLSSYIDLNYIPSNSLIFQKDSASWILKLGEIQSKLQSGHGVVYGANGITMIRNYTSISNSINSNWTSYGGSDRITGFNALLRRSSSEFDIARNNEYTTLQNVSTSLPPSSITIGKVNNQSFFYNSDTFQISCLASGLSRAEYEIFCSIMNNYIEKL